MIDNIFWHEELMFLGRKCCKKRDKKLWNISRIWAKILTFAIDFAFKIHLNRRLVIGDTSHNSIDTLVQQGHSGCAVDEGCQRLQQLLAQPNRINV